jgi:pyruvate dehydrogenase E2 component (dihydrolipoamide acetyltransferase)
MAAVIDIVIPDLGEFSDVDVIEILVKREDGLITLETDKATMDVPAPDFGVIEEMSVKVGDQVWSATRYRRETSSGGSQLKRAIRY